MWVKTSVMKSTVEIIIMYLADICRSWRPTAGCCANGEQCRSSQPPTEAEGRLEATACNKQLHGECLWHCWLLSTTSDFLLIVPVSFSTKLPLHRRSSLQTLWDASTMPGSIGLAKIAPPGLPLDRKWYLYHKIREFVCTASQEITYLKPASPVEKASVPQSCICCSCRAFVYFSHFSDSTNKTQEADFRAKGAHEDVQAAVVAWKIYWCLQNYWTDCPFRFSKPKHQSGFPINFLYWD